MTNSILIKGGALITLDAGDRILTGDVLIRDGRIASIGETADGAADEVIDARGAVVLPGFVQTHIHLCQTLFRGAADDLPLIDWLKRRVWPLEAAHTVASVRASARLGIAEMIKGGTTSALTMETVNHTAEVFRVVEETGFRATVGKCMMDAGDDVPAELFEQTDDSIRESLALLEEWHGRANGRVRACFAPRFAVSCTRELLEQVARLSRERGVLVHTHASENRTEIEMVERATGQRNIAYLSSLGLAAPHVALAHCVHLNADELDILARTGTHVLHCPSSNLKLGSGVAPILEMLARGISVSLGADGAPCNNRLDMFTEMRTAALLQKVTHGADALPARRVLRMATIDGARALGLEAETGTLEVGKRADVIVVALDRLHLTPRPDIVSAVVYAAEAADVRTVVIDGQVVMRERELTTVSEREVIEEATEQARQLFQRAQLDVEF
ncbi:MAG: 5-methylthioadenosine/S-adenosylhomocysteine deaminase [Pyrinomonadaceae bacterium]|jgi:5-methylthioadenosine/S-adenosylhomocysteine deaminase|nr:5-methylthioadenosine/S-adenosylhomocysteine deaminase [Pyrinomonadaceae bacterium]